MKIKAVIKACKARKNIHVVLTDDGKWMGDGATLWLMPEYMNIEKEGIFGMYDFSKSEQEKTAYTIEHAADTVIDFTEDDAQDAEILDIVLKINGVEYLPVKYEEGVCYIKTKYFEIFQDKPYTLKVKYTREQKPYIAVFEGLILVGLLAPCKIETKALGEKLKILSADISTKIKEG